jgi:tetratricopeptide (TPR) repeat protein
MCLNNLGNALESRYERSRDTSDLDEAVTTARKALKSLPLDNPTRAGYLSNLGNVLNSRYHESGDIEDLEQAIDAARRAVQSTPLGHPDRAKYLSNLGEWLGNWYKRSLVAKDLEEVSRCYLEAFDCIAAVPLVRVKAAASGLSVLADLKRIHEGETLGRNALALLPLIHS